MPDKEIPEVTDEAKKAGQDPTKVTAPTMEQLKEGVVSA